MARSEETPDEIKKIADAFAGIYRQGKAERFKIGNTYCYRLK